MSKRNKTQPELSLAQQNYLEGYQALPALFRPLAHVARIYRIPSPYYPQNGLAVVSQTGRIYTHPTRRATPQQWTYTLAHCLLHLAFGHFQQRANQEVWNAACDVFIAKFLDDLRLGLSPDEFKFAVGFPVRDEEQLYTSFCERGIPDEVYVYSTAGVAPDMSFQPTPPAWKPPDWSRLFGQGLTQAVTRAVERAGGLYIDDDTPTDKITPAKQAKAWFINSFPLLGALAATFKIIEDPLLCQRMGIMVAAVNPELNEIYMNPAAGLAEEECRFVMAHELLHVGLNHHSRAEGRDHYFWNVACDYVINSWLIEMGIGRMPALGGLYDPELKNESADSIYDRVVTNLRYYRKVATLRGVGAGDILDTRIPDWWQTSDGLALDDFYRRCLAQGFDLYQKQGRGLLPVGLLEAIKALGQPPMPWDVALAKWFDQYFAPLEKKRSYARLSRRQSTTPDIPRPRWVLEPGSDDGRTFGVLLDTSGSMDRLLLGKALGAIAAYSLTHDVAAVRVVFCDAAAYDQGYMTPEMIADRVMIRGRGGTILQPGIDLLERADDFPKDGPLLIITDGLCDVLHVRRNHAFLLPKGRRLPFAPHGEVFYIE